MDAVTTLQATIAGAAETVGPSVVGLGRGWGHGSGVVISEGHVLTSAHNLRRDETMVAFADGRRETGTVAAIEADLDLAVVAVNTGNAPAIRWEPTTNSPGASAASGATESGASGEVGASGGTGASGESGASAEARASGPSDESAASARSGALGIGAPVVALANPGGRGLRATLGFVSSGGRSFRGPRGRRIRGAIEHTAPLPRGSSGGPLVDREGNLLGINSLRLDGGLILAVPADASVKERILLLARGEGAAPHRLGVAIAPPRVARRLRSAVGLPERDGLLVRAVEEGGPAAGAGVEKGDLIVAAGGSPTENVEALYTALDAIPAAGGALELTVVRGTDERTVTATFAAEKAA